MKRDERLKAAVSFLKSKHGCRLTKDFADFAGIDRSTLSSAMNGNELYLTDSFIYKFAARFPDISLQWLLTGEGEMLRSSAPAAQQAPAAPAPAADLSARLDSLKDLLADSLAAKDSQIDRLLGIIERMQEEKGR